MIRLLPVGTVCSWASAHLYILGNVVTVDTMHGPVEFFHLHAAIADYFHHGGQRFPNFGLLTMKWIKLSKSL